MSTPPAPDPTPPPTARGRIIVGRWGAVCVLAALVATGCGRLGALDHRLDLFAHLQPQYALLTLAGWLGVCGLPAPWRRPGVMLGGACLLLQALWILPLYRGASAPAGAGPDRSVVLINVLTRNRDYGTTRAWVREVDPDVAVLLEIDADWREALRPLEDRWPHVLEDVRQDNFGIVVMSRHPLVDGRVIDPARVGVPTLVASVAWPDAPPVCLVATHPVPPMRPTGFQERNRQLEALVPEVTDRPGGVWLVGDLNITVFSPVMRDFLVAGGLRHAREGHGVLPTWPTTLPALFRIGIDHVLHDPTWTTVDFALGPDLGSDHLPVLARLRRKTTP